MPRPSALPIHPDPSARQGRSRPSICPYPSIPPSPWGRTQHRDPISRLLPHWRCKAASPLGPNGGNYMSMAPGAPWCSPAWPSLDGPSLDTGLLRPGVRMAHFPVVCFWCVGLSWLTHTHTHTSVPQDGTACHFLSHPGGGASPLG